VGLFIFLVKKEMQAAMEDKSVRIRSNSNFLHKTDTGQERIIIKATVQVQALSGSIL